LTGHRILVASIIALLFFLYLYFDAGAYFQLDYLVQKKEFLQELVSENLFLSSVTFMLLYIAITAVSLPGAAIMTVAAGTIFGIVIGVVYVSFASTIGATLAFLISRYLFRDYIKKHFTDYIKTINKGLEKEGIFYLFTLRLVPLFPFFVINMVMGITDFRARTFYWVSQLGMLPGTIVYVNAGVQLDELESMADILSPELVLSFVLLAIFPYITGKIVRKIRRNRMKSGFSRPRKFDRNLVVIGAGSAGLVAAYIAAQAGAKVSIIEKQKMGGDCLNTGCVPSKALIRAAKCVTDIRNSERFGVKAGGISVDFKQVMNHVRDAIRKIEPHDSVERYSSLGVDCIIGEATIVSPYCIEVNGRQLTTRSIIIASGAHPLVPDLPGLDDAGYHTSDTLWDVEELPRNLVILGGGPIGCELAQAFARLGSRVTIVENMPRLLSREDVEVSGFITSKLEDDGVDIRQSHLAKAVMNDGGSKYLVCENDNTEVKIPFDTILVAIGRKANTKGLELDRIGVKTRKNGTIETDEYLETTMPGIYASGDVTGPYQFTHSAAHQSWYAAINSLFGFLWRFRIDYDVIPQVTFTSPEIARVGLNEEQAQEMNIEYEVARYDLSELDRAITEGVDNGFVKVIMKRGKDRILGATVVGHNAGELISEYVLAMKHGLGLGKILGTIHAYPTMAESSKYVAGVWRKNHKPEFLLDMAKRIHGSRL